MVICGCVCVDLHVHQYVYVLSMSRERGEICVLQSYQVESYSGCFGF